MVALTLVLAPTTTPQAGTGATLVGGATAHAVLADSSDTSYVQVDGRRRLDGDGTRVGFAAASLPAGAQILSVGLRRRTQTVLAGTPRPRPIHWFRCLGTPPAGVGGATQTTVADVFRDYLISDVPTSTNTTTWVEEDVWSTERGPDGKPWTATGNLATLTSDLGREDTTAAIMRVSKLSLLLTYQRQSTVTVTGPTGTVTTTCRPTVMWTYASLDSEPQAEYRVAIYTQAQTATVGFAPFVTTPTQQSGWLLGEALAWTLTSDVVNGVWFAYVQAKAKFDGPTDFPTTVASTSWTQSMVGAPNAVIQSAIHDQAANHIRLTILPSSASPATYAFAVETQRGTNPWTPVRGGLLKLATGMTPIVLDDHEFELNEANRYRALAYGTSGPVLIPAAGYSAEATVTPASDRWWLLDPQNPLDKIPLPVADKGDTMTFDQVMGVFKPVGGRGERAKFVVRGPVYLPDGELTIYFTAENPQADEHFATFQRMRANGRTLLLQKQTGDNLYVALGASGNGGEPIKVEYWSRGGRKVTYRSVTCGYTSTAPPSITS